MPICPYDLELCDRPACMCGICQKTDVPTFTACADCGALMEGRGNRVCVGCIDVSITVTAET